MAGRPRPDAAFLGNVPTIISSTSSSTVSSLVSSLTSALSSSTSSSATVSVSTASASTTSSTLTTPTPTSQPSATTPSFYAYDPSSRLALTFAVLYASLLGYHLYLSIYKPYLSKSVSTKHSYTIPLSIAALLSTLGYSLRRVSGRSESSRQDIALYTASSTATIVAPVFVCASLYLGLAYLIRLCLPAGGERVFLEAGPRGLGRGFVVSDGVSLLCQGVGSAVMVGGNRGVGRVVLVVGLAAQVVTFTAFLVVFGLFCGRVRRGGTREKIHGVEGEEGRRDFGFNPLVRKVVVGMWIASGLVEVRSSFRTIEFGMGVEGYLFQHEWTLWVFEAVPMWLALLVLGIWHPVKWLQQKRRSQFVDKYNHASHAPQVVTIDTADEDVDGDDRSTAMPEQPKARYYG